MEHKIPDNNRVVLYEFLCAECDNEFYTSDNAKELDCPKTFCTGKAENYGPITAFIRYPEKDE